MGSSTRLYMALVHPLDMQLQSRVAGRKASQVDFRVGSEFRLFTHRLAQEFGPDDIHRRFAILSVHQSGKLFQLLQHVRLEDSVLTELQKCFVKHGVFYSFSWDPPSLTL